MSGTRIARGVFRDAYGYEVRWRHGGRTKTKHFPLDTPFRTLEDFRDTRARIGQQRTAYDRGGSFTRDAVRFLAGRKTLASYKSDRAHLRPWIQRFGRASRFVVTREGVQGAIRFWQGQGYSPRELRHRWRILSQFFATLDPDAPNPCKGIKLPKMPKTRPRSVPDSLVREVAQNLLKSELLYRHDPTRGLRHGLRDAKTRARYLVLATTGQRPAQLRRTKPADVDLERRVWFVEPAKGDAGTIIYLNDDMYAAWCLFIAANAWGAFDQRAFVKTLQRNGWPKGIRPYNLRHSVGLALSELGVDLGDIQAHMGHTSPTTTRIYVPGLLERLKVASAKLDGRLGPSPFYYTGAPTAARESKAKARENAPQNQTSPEHEKGRSGRLKSAKTA